MILAVLATITAPAYDRILDNGGNGIAGMMSAA
jgi:hypothetical protein